MRDRKNLLTNSDKEPSVFLRAGERRVLPRVGGSRLPARCMTMTSYYITACTYADELDPRARRRCSDATLEDVLERTLRRAHRKNDCWVVWQQDDPHEDPCPAYLAFAGKIWRPRV